MTNRAQMMSRARSNMPALLVVVAVSFAMLQLGKWTSAREHAAEPRVLSGRASPLTDDLRLACCSDSKLSSGGERFSVASVRWRDARKGEKSWHEEGVPACLSKTDPNLVRMGVVTIKNRGGGPAIDVAGWVECR